MINTPSNISRKHHYVPQWYLRYWADSSGRLSRARKVPSGWLFDKTLPENVAFEKDLHRVFGSLGNAGYSFEEDFMTPHVDSPFSILHRLLLSKGLNNFSNSERYELCRYLCALQIRNPNIIRKHFEPIFEVGVKPPSYLTITEMVEFLEEQKKLKDMFHSSFDFAKLIAEGLLRNIDTHADIINSKQWVVIPYPKDKNLLVTTDLPFISTQDFSSPKSIYIFPVTPSLVLLAHDHWEYICKILKADLRIGFAYINFVMILKAREVYYQNKAHEKLIERYAGCMIPSVTNDTEKHHAQAIIEDFVRFIPEYIKDFDIES